jgi:5'-deoxynucleotidase YfbR-like HD superfamily hydrolase
MKAHPSQLARAMAWRSTKRVARTTIDAVTDAQVLALCLAMTDRATPMPFGGRETVATHSLGLVLALIAADEAIPPRLDRATLYSFAAVHDAVEAVTGDVDTSLWSPELQQAKDALEQAGRAALINMLPKQLYRTWLDYERQDTAEARTVRLFDKVMPKVQRWVVAGVDDAQLPDEDVARRELDAQARRLELDAPEEWRWFSPIFDRAGALLLKEISAQALRRAHEDGQAVDQVQP